MRFTQEDAFCFVFLGKLFHLFSFWGKNTILFLQNASSQKRLFFYQTIPFSNITRAPFLTNTAFS